MLSKGGHFSLTCQGQRGSWKFNWNSNTLEYIMPAEVTQWSQELPNCNSALNHVPPDPSAWKQRRHSSDLLINTCSQVALFIAPPARGRNAACVYFIKNVREREQGSISWEVQGQDKMKISSRSLEWGRTRAAKTEMSLYSLSSKTSSFPTAWMSPISYLQNDSQHTEMSPCTLYCIV